MNLNRHFYPSKFGGKPSWLIPNCYPENLQCKKCEKSLSFLLQLYNYGGDLYGSTAFHRMLYVFTCDTCVNVFECYKQQLPSDNEYYSNKNPHENEELYSEIIKKLNDKEEILEGCCLKTGLPKNGCINLCSKKKCKTTGELVLKKQNKLDLTVYPKVYEEYEILVDEQDDDDIVTESDSDSEDDSENLIDTIILKKEALEKYKIYLEKEENRVINDDMDETEMGYFQEWNKKYGPKKDLYFKEYQKFIQRFDDIFIRHIQYEKYVKGLEEEPLWYSKENRLLQENIPKCQICNCTMKYEFQILSNLIYLKDTHHDFGTVIIYTCENSCDTKNKCKKEYVYVQDEPDESVDRK